MLPSFPLTKDTTQVKQNLRTFLLILTFSTTLDTSLWMLQMKAAMPSDWLTALLGKGMSMLSPPCRNACRSTRATGTRLTGSPKWSFTNTCREEQNLKESIIRVDQKKSH